MEFSGANIRAEIARNGMRLQDAANVIGLSDTAFRQKIRGEREFTLTELCRLADCFSVSIDYLAERNTTSAPDDATHAS